MEYHKKSDMEDAMDGSTVFNNANAQASKQSRKFRCIDDIYCVPGHRTSLCNFIQIDSEASNGASATENRFGGWGNIHSNASVSGHSSTISMTLNGKKVRYKNDGLFHIRADGELYGPFYRVRVSPYTFSSQLGGQNITFPIASFTKPSQ